MKHLYLLLLLYLPFSLSAESATDTITNWQVYKDGKLLLKSHESNPEVATITINISDDFKELKIQINQDTRRENVKRRMMFKIDGKIRVTAMRTMKSSEDPVIIPKGELLRLIGPDTNVTFTVEFTDDAGPKGTVLFKLVVKD